LQMMRTGFVVSTRARMMKMNKMITTIMIINMIAPSDPNISFRPRVSAALSKKL
jgi:hypothetical protein